MPIKKKTDYPLYTRIGSLTLINIRACLHILKLRVGVKNMFEKHSNF